MGAAAKIWNAMDVAAEARGCSSSDVKSSRLTVESSFPLHQMTPCLMFVTLLSIRIWSLLGHSSFNFSSFSSIPNCNFFLADENGWSPARNLALCKDLFDEWSSLVDSCFAVERVSGGITNLLLKVTVKEEGENAKSVTVRLYGPNTDYVINRERELHAIKYLSAAGFGAKLLGVFGNGMVQSFINARTLVPSDMGKPNLAADIAKELHKFHQVEIPGSKEPQLWNDIFKFYDKSSILQFDDSEKQKKYTSISFEEIYDELTELKELTALLNSPVVFAHNDLLCGNIMVNDEEGKLYFIDFEYGSYSYRGFDIGNHFNEYGGYECDYTLYPSKDEQYHFFRNYLHPDEPDMVPEKEVEAVYIEANTYRLTSHVFWALWALIQAKMSPIDFDYVEYFFLRYNEFKKQKQESCSLVRRYLASK